MTAYQDIIAKTLNVTPDRAILVEAYLRMTGITLGNLSDHDMHMEYTLGGICEAIDTDPDRARMFARQCGLLARAKAKA